MNHPTVIDFFKSKTNYKLFERNCICIYVYPFQYLKIRRDISFYSKADYILLDGMFLTTLFNLFRVSNNHRMSIDFSSIANKLFTYISEQNYSVFFIGATEIEIHSFIINMTNSSQTYTINTMQSDLSITEIFPLQSSYIQKSNSNYLDIDLLPFETKVIKYSLP